jgi:hypothetical protein
MAKVSRIAKSLYLSDMVRNVGTAIKQDISTDPFGYGIDTAVAFQNMTLWRIQDQQRELSSIVQPYDTTLASVRVNNVSYRPGEMVYLAPGTKTVSLQVTTSQRTAKAAIQPRSTLKPGINSAWVVVTSADKKHVNSYDVPLYVYTAAVKKSTVSFHSLSTVPTFSGISNTGTLGTELEISTKLTIDFQMLKTKSTTTAKAKALMASRVKYVLTSLSKRGIKPTKVTQTLTSSGATNNLVVIAKFEK